MLKRKLLLSDSAFPDKLESSEITHPVVLSKQQYIENKIIEGINNYNSKLKVSSIEYIRINEQFPDLNFFGIYTGIIVEDIEIQQSEKELNINKKYFVWEDTGRIYARKIVLYVIMSDYMEKSRSAFSQLFFPVLIEFMRFYNSSPSFSIANLPIYYINFQSKVSSNNILKQTAGMIISDIEYIDVFNINPKLKNVSSNMDKFSENYLDNYNPAVLLYSCDNFEIDRGSKVTTIKTNKLVIGDCLKIKSDGKYSFDGSKEKFYWIDILPIIILSCKNGYKIDYSLLKIFYDNNITNFSINDDKFRRFFNLIEFIKKINEGIKN